jgi:hypothetical protein
MIINLIRESMNTLRSIYDYILYDDLYDEV